MTLKDFADKYGLKYQTVYAASYRVRFSQLSSLDRKEYPEDELYKAIDEMLKDRIKAHQQKLDNSRAQLDKLHGN